MSCTKVCNKANTISLVVGSTQISKAPINIVTNPHFMHWFGDSTVKTSNGAPMIVFHGTYTGFDEFVVRRNKEDEIGGIHFGTQDQATTRLQRFKINAIKKGKLDDVDRYSEEERILPVYVRLEKPLRVNDPISWNMRRIIERGLRDPQCKTEKQIKSDLIGRYNEIVSKYDKLATERGTTMSRYGKRIWEDERKALLEVMDKYGFDGFVYENYCEGVGDDSWCVLRPEQVKSIYNSGTFSESRSIFN